MISPHSRKMRNDASNRFAWREASSIRAIEDKKQEADKSLMMSPNRKKQRHSGVCHGFKGDKRQTDFLTSAIENLKILDTNSPTKFSRYGNAPTESSQGELVPRQPEKFFREFLHEGFTESTAYVHDGTVFHPFSRLPTEVRLEIWKLARPDPQIVRLKLKKDGHNVYSTTPVPGIVQACKESRCYSLEKWYTLNKPSYYSRYSLPRVTFYFNPEVDIMFKGCEECDSVAYCLKCFSLWPYEVCDVVKTVMMQGNSRTNRTFSRYLFITTVISCPLVKEVIILSPDCTASRISNIQLSMANLTHSSYTFDWQNSGSILQISPALTVPIYHPNSSRKKIILEKASCMELGITPQTSKLYGFLKTKFERMNVRDLLQRNIPNTRAFENRHQKDPREAHFTKRRPIRKTGPKSMQEAIEENRRERIRGVIRKQLERGPDFFTQLCNRAAKAAEGITGSIYVGPNPRLHGVRIGGKPGVFTIGLLGLD